MAKSLLKEISLMSSRLKEVLLEEDDFAILLMNLITADGCTAKEARRERVMVVKNLTAAGLVLVGRWPNTEYHTKPH